MDPNNDDTISLRSIRLRFTAALTGITDLQFPENFVSTYPNPEGNAADIDLKNALAGYSINLSVENQEGLYNVIRKKNINTKDQLEALIKKAEFRDFTASIANGASVYASGFGLNNLLRPLIAQFLEEHIKHLSPAAAGTVGTLARVAIPALMTTLGAVALGSSAPSYNPLAPPAHSQLGPNNDPLFNATLNTPFLHFTEAYAIADPASALLGLDPWASAAAHFSAGLMAAMRRAYDSWQVTEARKATAKKRDDGQPGMKQNFLNAADLDATEGKIDDLQANLSAPFRYVGAVAGGAIKKMPEAALTALMSPNSYGQLMSLLPTGLAGHLASIEPDPIKAQAWSFLATGLLITGWNTRTELSKGLTALTGGSWTHPKAAGLAGSVTSGAAKLAGDGTSMAFRAIQGLFSHAPSPEQANLADDTV